MIENTLLLFEKNKFPVLMGVLSTKQPTIVAVQKYFVIREKVMNYSWSSDLYLI